MVQILSAIGIEERTELWRCTEWGSIARENGTWLGIWRVISLSYKDTPVKKIGSVEWGFCWENAGEWRGWIHWIVMVLLWPWGRGKPALGWRPASGFPAKLAGDVFQENASADITMEETTRKGPWGGQIPCLSVLRSIVRVSQKGFIWGGQAWPDMGLDNWLDIGRKFKTWLSGGISDNGL